MKHIGKPALLALFWLLAAAAPAHAQQTPVIGFFRQNWQMINPASMDLWSYRDIGGWRRVSMLTLSHRSQWVGSGIEGAPVFTMASFEHTPEINKSGEYKQPYKWGVVAYRDQTDAISTSGLNLTGSYFWSAGDGYAHIGAGLGAVQYGVDGDKLRAADGSDPVLADAVQTRYLVDFSIGALYRDDRQYYGISMPQTLQEFVPNSARRTHFYGVAGWFFDTNDEDVKTEITTWLRYTPGLAYRTIGTLPMSADVVGRVFFNEKYRLGKKVMNTISWWAGGGVGTALTAQVEFGAEIERGWENFDKRNCFRISLIYNRAFAQRTAVLGNSLELAVATAWN